MRYFSSTTSTIEGMEQFIAAKYKSMYVFRRIGNISKAYRLAKDIKRCELELNEIKRIRYT
jgi:hypothetical protein